MIFKRSNELNELYLDNFEGKLTQTIVLSHMSWSTYQAMLRDMGESQAIRTAYSQGILSLKSPSRVHEKINRLLAAIVQTLSGKLNRQGVNSGSKTIQNPELAQAIDPDSGFYLNRSELHPSDSEQIKSLLPDLVIEIDLTSPSTQRMDIYHDLKIPEVWRYSKSRGLVIYQYESFEYIESEISLTFPRVTATRLNDFLILRQTQPHNRVIRAVQNWSRKLEQRK
ncbi:Uma2 family endonuclease [Roseofilum capinflatum]|uniref:Uma2 family endonuclease n=1 Tax=Roseofilum capinflatum BLCC-M114 TaxID=3022440 RepID=A0ABT7B9Y5_9CYAN|nr:Uma2 family endonuclease [Roseofilum capinflatum]MDJ1175326.1 Uma2 family endonuclease [Roseofilum capinflatum BLCC-M114]